jgi:hypothetical protein
VHEGFRRGLPAELQDSISSSSVAVLQPPAGRTADPEGLAREHLRGNAGKF